MKITGYLIPGRPTMTDPLGQRSFAVIAVEKEACLYELDATASEDDQRAEAALHVAVEVFHALGGGGTREKFGAAINAALAKPPHIR